MDSTKRILKYQSYGLKKGIGVFWLVMLIINVLSGALTLYTDSNVKIGAFITDTDVLSMTGANIVPIFIFLIIYGILIYYEDFALALSFGVTRLDFYKSTIVTNILVVLSFAVVQGSLLAIEKFTVRFFNYELMVDFALFNISTDSILFVIFTLFMVFMTFVSVMNLLGILNYRYGYKFWIGFGVVSFGLMIFFGNLRLDYNSMFESLGVSFGNTMLFILGLAIAIVSHFLGYVFLRKANIRN